MKTQRMCKKTPLPLFIAILLAAMHFTTTVNAIDLAPGAGAAAAGVGAGAAAAGAGARAAAAGAGAGVAGLGAGAAAAGAGTGAAGAAEASVIEFYMHDILGGSSPTARPITGLLGNIYSGQVPFARPLGFQPPKNGIAVPNSNGALPTVNGVPLGTGLAGSAFSGTTTKTNNVQTINTQLAPDGLGLGFGTITVIDDILTASPDLGNQMVGKAQGVYVASSADGSSQLMAFTAMLEGGEYGDSINFFGAYKIGSTMSQLSVTGGTGKFSNACGFAELRPLVPPGQQILDGAETLLRIVVHLSY